MVIQTYSRYSIVAYNHDDTIWHKHQKLYLYMAMNIRNGVRDSVLGIA